MLSETAHARHENEVTEYLQCKMVASASWVQEPKSRTISTGLPRSAVEEKEGPGQTMFINSLSKVCGKVLLIISGFYIKESAVCNSVNFLFLLCFRFVSIKRFY